MMQLLDFLLVLNLFVVVTTHWIGHHDQYLHLIVISIGVTIVVVVRRIIVVVFRVVIVAVLVPLRPDGQLVSDQRKQDQTWP